MQEFCNRLYLLNPHFELKQTKSDPVVCLFSSKVGFILKIPLIMVEGSRPVELSESLATPPIGLMTLLTQRPEQKSKCL